MKKLLVLLLFLIISVACSVQLKPQNSEIKLSFNKSITEEVKAESKTVEHNSKLKKAIFDLKNNSFKLGLLSLSIVSIISMLASNLLIKKNKKLISIIMAIIAAICSAIAFIISGASTFVNIATAAFGDSTAVGNSSFVFISFAAIFAFAVTITAGAIVETITERTINILSGTCKNVLPDNLKKEVLFYKKALKTFYIFMTLHIIFILV